MMIYTIYIVLGLTDATMFLKLLLKDILASCTSNTQSHLCSWACMTRNPMRKDSVLHSTVYIDLVMVWTAFLGVMFDIPSDNKPWVASQKNATMYCHYEPMNDGTFTWYNYRTSPHFGGWAKWLKIKALYGNLVSNIFNNILVLK